MGRYYKNSIDYEYFRRKEIEVYRYDGTMDNAPKWVLEALHSGELTFLDDGKLYVPRYCLQVQLGWYIALKLPRRGYGDIACLNEEYLNKMYTPIVDDQCNG